MEKAYPLVASKPSVSPVIKAMMKKKLSYYVKRWKTKMKKDYSVILQCTHYTMGAN